MAVEIELKAKVDNPEEIKNRLIGLAVFRGTFEKNDVYYISEVSGNDSRDAKNPDYGIRIRKEEFEDASGNSKKSSIVTWKSKDVRDGIEVNNENEFEVSSGQVFEDLIRHLGLKKRIAKRKTGSVFDYFGMTAELSDIDGLGWFLELEIIISEKDEKNVEIQKEKLLSFLDKLGISGDSIESRSYAMMLAEKFSE